MKNFKRLISMILVVMMVSVLFCTVSVSAAVTSGKGKLYVSHFNQNDVFANAGVLFTKAYAGEKTLQDITADYVAVADKALTTTYSEWAGNYANHGFVSYNAVVCTWNEENARYEVTAVGLTSACANLTVPENGFIFAMHHDDDTDGRHNYKSNEFADLNYGAKATYTIRSEMNALLNQPVYLYNIDLEKTETGSGIVTSGKFHSKMSSEGLANGLVEIYENFKTESYLYFGEEDPDATVAPYQPKNVTVSFKKIDTLKAEVAELFQPDYTDSSWKNLVDALNKYDEAGKAALDNKGVSAWATEIRTAIDNLVPYEEGEEEGGTDGGNEEGAGNFGNIDEGGFNILYVVIPVAALLVIGGVVFLLVAMKKSKKPEEKTEEKVEEKVEEEKTEEKPEETQE